MARKRLNKKLVLALTMLGSLTLIVLAAVMLKQLSGVDPAKFVAMAEEAVAEEDWEQALLFYHKAWERSGDAKYLVDRGRMALENGRIDAAVGSWSNAIINEPELIEAHTKLLDLHLELAVLYDRLQLWLRVRDAANDLLEIDADKPPQTRAQAHHALGMALIHLSAQDEKNPAKGIEQLEQAVELAPEQVDYALDLTREKIDQGRIEDGADAFQNLLAQFDESNHAASKVQLAWAQYLTRHGEFDEAEAYYEKSIELAGDDSQAHLEAALGLAAWRGMAWERAKRDGAGDADAQQLFDAAESLLKQIAAEHPDEFLPALQLATLYRAADRHQDAVAVCDERLERGLTRKGVKAARNANYFFGLNIEASRNCVARARVVDSRDEKVDWLTRAEEFVEQALGEAPNNPAALAQRGHIRLAQGRERDALRAFREADEGFAAYDRVDWDTKKALAAMHLRVNEPGAARSLLEAVATRAAAERGGDLQFWLLYGQALHLTGDHDEAIRIAESILNVTPNQPQVRKLRAAALEAKGELAMAERSLPSSSPESALVRAKIASLEGEDEEALRILRNAAELHPTDEKLVTMFVRMLTGADRWQEAQEVLDRALDLNPGSTALRGLKEVARPNLTTEQREDRVLAIINETEDAYQRALDLLAFHLTRGHWEQALSHVNEAEALLIDKASDAAADAPRTHHRTLLRNKLSIGQRLDDQDAAREARDSAIKHNVDGAGGQTIAGLYHMQAGEWGQAVAALKSALDRQPTDVQALTALGECLLEIGDYGEARNYFERAVRTNDKAGRAHRGLARLAELRGDEPAMARHLERCTQLIPNDPWVQAGMMALRDKENPRAAIKRRKSLAEKEPDDISNHYRLARLCQQVGDTDCADRHYGRVLDMQPDNNLLHAVVCRYYLETDRTEKSLALARSFAESREGNEARANGLVLVATHFLLTEQNEKVEATLKSAADVAVTREVAQSLGEFYRNETDRMDEAVEWYDKAAEIARQQDDSELAGVLAARVRALLDRRIDDVTRAREGVDELKSRFPEDDSILLLESDVYARAGKIEDAVRALSRFLRDEPGNVRVRYQKAQHELTLGNTATAIADLETIKRADPLALDLNPRILLARLYYRDGQQDKWLNELESLHADAPQNERALEELVRAYISERRFAEAESIITAQINRNEGSPDARWFALRGRVAYELQDYAKALRDYRRAAELRGYNADAIAHVIDVYIQAGRWEEGLNWYTQHAPDPAPPALAARHGWLLSRAGRETETVAEFRDAMRRAIEGGDGSAADVWRAIAAAMATDQALALFEDNPQDPALNRANDRILTQLYATAGRYEQAEPLYDRLLASATGDRQRAALLQERGTMYLNANRIEDARKSYEEALKYDENNWVLLNNLAFLLADALGEYEKALPYAERAVARSETSWTLDTLGWIYVGLGDYRRAVAELSRALRMDPDSAGSYYHLGEAKRRDRQFTEAVDILEQGLNLARAANNTDRVKRIESALDKAGRLDATP